MNKYQKALNKITPTTNDYKLIDATNLMQELVDKETPMPLNGHACPNGCKEFIAIERMVKINRCDECGQIIDWSDYE